MVEEGRGEVGSGEYAKYLFPLTLAVERSVSRAEERKAPDGGGMESDYEAR